MRRPTLCSGAVAPVPGPTDDCYSTEKDTESRLARVKRMLSGTLLAGRRGRTFGLRLEELPAGADGVPKILVRLCAYIELHGMRCGGLFRLSAGNPKLVERLRASFDRTGDADLESAGDAATVASLLKLWIRDLPEPLITASVVTELVAVHEKLHDEPAQWRESVAHTLRGLPDPNSRVLCFLLRFLFRYDQHLHNAQCHHHTAGGVAAIFSPLLLHRAMDIHTLQQTMTTQIMNKLIHECHYIFSERLVDHAIQVAVGGGDLRLFAAGSTGTTQNQQKQTNAVIVAELANTHKQQQQRKRKERHESFNSQTQERKVIRSNSEERPLEEGNTNNKDSIRRVSSHEDFSLVKGNSKNNKDINKHKKSFLSELIDPAMGHGVRASGLPLHERNLPTTGAYSSNTYGKPHVSGTTESETAVLQDNELFDDNEHERRRSTEWFARAVAPRGRRNMARRRRTVHKAVKSSPEDNDGGGSSKENEDQEEITSRSHHQAPPPPPPTTHNSSEDEGVSSRSSSAHSFMQLHPQVARIERERSPSPVPSPCTPPLDLSTLHEQVDCSEPLTSHASWNLEGDEQEKMIANSRVMLSPRNSMILTRRVYLDPNVPPSPPQEHDVPSSHGVADAKIKQLSKQVHSMKKKLKKFEEEFELSHGYHPSHADKMANKEIKKLCTELNKFRKELKQLKENPSEVLLPGVGHSSSEDKLLSSKPATMEEIVQEVEKILRDKREATGRPEALDELTREQLLDEKVAMQKSLLHLEDAFGRPVTKSDRDLVRPLYDRYRLLKRMIIRTAPSKMKDSISELATIHEHETMDFTSSPSSLTGQEEMVTSEPHATEINGDSTLVSQMQLSGSSENLMENLHAMPLSELLSQQRSLREEKKCLRRTLREFEEDFQRRMGRKLQREDRIPMEGVYTSYKQAKAKLRLLEALVTKQT